MLAEYLASIISLIIIQILGLISQGPNLAITVRNSLLYSRKTAMITALGISFGIMLQVAVIVLGFGLIVLETQWLYKIIKFGGSFYLIYLGLCSLKAKNKFIINMNDFKPVEDISAIKAMSTGFLINILNPTVMIYFLSIFTAFLSPDTPTQLLCIYVLIIYSTTLAWYSGLAYCLSHEGLRQRFSTSNHWIEFIAGAIFITIGVRILLEACGLM